MTRVSETHYKETPSFLQIAEPIRQPLIRSISINSGYSSQVQPPKEPGGQPKQLGNKTECALLGFVLALGQNYQTIRDEVPDTTFVKVRNLKPHRIIDFELL